jgi:LCP family protein required for cell wall assembly
MVCSLLAFTVWACFACVEGGPINTLLSPIARKTNFVILGLDKSGRRTDSIIAGCLNTENKSVNLLSIPRDTLVTVSADRLDVMKKRYPGIPGDGRMKINSVYTYGGEEYGADFAVKQAEDLLGVKIQYYVTINLSAFRYIVDQIGGVEYDVPFHMKYADPAQDLVIDLPPGLQLLNGEQAEGLVRYRKSDDGSHAEYTDLSRAQTQQAFIKALAGKIISEKNLLENAAALISAWREYTDTNMDPTAIAKYLKHIREFKRYDISSNMLITKEAWINGSDYIIVDAEASGDAIERVFGLVDGELPNSSKGKPIKVLNGGALSGLAARGRVFLINNGFTVSGIGNYESERTAYTRIFVKREGMGGDIQALYPGSKIIVDGEAFDEEVVVVLGLEAE